MLIKPHRGNSMLADVALLDYMGIFKPILRFK